MGPRNSHSLASLSTESLVFEAMLLWKEETKGIHSDGSPSKLSTFGGPMNRCSKTADDANDVDPVDEAGTGGGASREEKTAGVAVAVVVVVVGRAWDVTVVGGGAAVRGGAVVVTTGGGRSR